MQVKNSLLVIAILLLYTMSYSQMDSGFVVVRTGVYVVGKKGYSSNPYRKVSVKEFSIARTETTNRDFEKFVLATAYVTDAERLHNAMVFRPGLKEFEWKEDSSASWRYPNGKEMGGIGNKMNHPVTCISYNDILQYCKWAGVRLPNLDEWEIACRAGSTTDYFFGNDDLEINKYANIWNGKDHLTADSSDGYMFTSPVATFQANPWGLFDMYGNVFEFCSGKINKTESKTIAHARGGSWWCSKNACHYFSSYHIGRVNVHASFSNQGFRVIKSE
ncbi:MAG: SUMF1/EgtB/PvdO family nonheme iron enzyme [Chitinophagaceae bacterium]